MFVLIHLGQISLQTDIFGPGSHLPAYSRRLGSDRLHLLLHLLPNSWDAHEGSGTHLLQGVHQRALVKEKKKNNKHKCHMQLTVHMERMSAEKTEICNHNVRHISWKTIEWKTSFFCVHKTSSHVHPQDIPLTITGTSGHLLLLIHFTLNVFKCK